MKELYAVYGEPGTLEGIDCIENYVPKLDGKCTYFCYAKSEDDAIRIITNAIEFGILPYGKLIKGMKAINSAFFLNGSTNIEVIPHLSYIKGSYEVGISNKNCSRVIYSPGPWNKEEIFRAKCDSNNLH